MLTPTTRAVQGRVSTLLRVSKAAGSRSPCQTFRPASIQTRYVAAVPGKNKDNMGGPGGQEQMTESLPFRRRYAMNTMLGVVAACSIMLLAKVARVNPDRNAGYVLVHDNSKGELDDVKYVKASDLPKS